MSNRHDGYDDGHNDDTAPSPFERPNLCAECLLVPVDLPGRDLCVECAAAPMTPWCATCNGTGQRGRVTLHQPVVSAPTCDECGGTGEAS
jgi:hypothetical protein